MTTHARVELRAELKQVARRFEDLARTLNVPRGPSRFDPGIRPDNLALTLPFFLIEALPFDGGLSAARAMSLGNAFATAHFLIEDHLVDGDDALSPEAVGLSGRCLVQFLRAYATLPDVQDRLWDDLDRYLGEYFGTLTWETEVLRTSRGAGAVGAADLNETLRRLGHRMAPLKVTGATIASMAGRRDALPTIERFVDEFHAGYQLADDLEDLEDDLHHGRWSVVAWIIARAAGLKEPPRSISQGTALDLAARTGALASVTEMIRREYDVALEVARGLGSPSLVAHMERLIDRTTCEHGRLLRCVRLSIRASSMADGAGAGNTAEDRGDENGSGSAACGAGVGGAVEDAVEDGASGLAAGAVPTISGTLIGPACRADGSRREFLEGIHPFTVGSQGYIYDIASGLFFEADPLAMSLISWLEDGAEPVDLRVLEMDHGAGAVREGLTEIALLRGSIDEVPCVLDRCPSQACLSGITCVALHLTRQCNLRCDYCYGRRVTRADAPMPEEVALRAVDLLFEESLGEPHASIVFFGGEPLLRPDLIERVIEHVESARRWPRGVTFHVTTNGTLLTSELASRLTHLGVRILVSIDGTPADHDRHRVLPDGRGSYATLAARLRDLPPGTRIGGRATVTPESGPLCDIVSHLADLGCSVVHLAPVSSGEMARHFSERLMGEFEELAKDELRRTRGGTGPIVGNFVEALAMLDTGRVRLLPCGAGSRYLSVAPDGVLYLCHRFVGNPAYAVGDVFAGMDRAKIGRILEGFVERAEGCSACWARWLCGGPCFYDLDTCTSDSSGPGAARCALRLRVLELAMWLYASLPPDQRRRAIGIGRREVRPELGPGRRVSSGRVGGAGRGHELWMRTSARGD